MLKVNIDEIVIEKTQVINRFEATVTQYVLNEYCILIIECYLDDKYVVGVSYRLPDDVFEDWGENDEYINNYVAQNLKQIVEQNEN